MKPLGNRPEITLIVDSEADAEAAKLLIGVLGLVQLEVVRSPEEVASSSHTLISLQSEPEGLFDFEGDVLQLEDNSNSVVRQETLGEFKRFTTYAPSALTTNSLSPVARFVQAAFWLDQRLFKASQPLSDSELALWRFVCGIAKQLGQGESVAWDTICARIAEYQLSAEPVSSDHQIPSDEVAGTFLEMLSPVTRRQVDDAGA